MRKLQLLAAASVAGIVTAAMLLFLSAERPPVAASSTKGAVADVPAMSPGASSQLPSPQAVAPVLEPEPAQNVAASQPFAVAGPRLLVPTPSQAPAQAAAPPATHVQTSQSKAVAPFDPAKAAGSGVWYHPDLPENEVRARMAAYFAARASAEKARAVNWATARGLPTRVETPQGTQEIMRLDQENQPIYYTTDNVNAAKTTAANLLRNANPYNVNGTNATKPYNIGEWDAGSVRGTHQEFKGSRITNKNSSAAVHSHATHVAGTIAASGVDANALGMAPASNILAYDWTSDVAEMTAEAATSPVFGAKILVSNHSYGISCGWNGTTWMGRADEREDRKFGQYSSDARDLDALAANSPYHLQMWSAGNDRSHQPPAPGTTFTFQSTGVTAAYNPAIHPVADGAKGGYDTVGPRKTAKNILTVGAVTAAVNEKGQRDVTKVQVSTFGAWGPTDDGRIKPDVVADGVNVYSTESSGDAAYSTKSGTSMATPNTTGSAIFLQEVYGDNFAGEAMRASTLKALLIHTADDIFNPGPDYRSGWGVVNVKSGADVILSHKDAPANKHLIESVLTTTVTSEQFAFEWDGVNPIRVTLCWADPAGTAQTGMNTSTSVLVNDLDVRVTGPSGVVQPYVLNPASPATDATRGDNVRDNVEQVFVAAPVAGTYTVVINHKGTLSGGQQAYSLIQTGLRANSPVIALSATAMSISTAAATNAAPQTFTVSNSGSRTLAYSISDDVSWLSVSPATGTATTESDPILVNFSTTSLVAGSYTGRIRVTAPGAAPAELVVSLNVTGTSVPLAQAVDLPLASLTPGGTAAWFGQTAESYDGVSAARSGPIGHGQESSFSLPVTGPGTVSFWWRTDSQVDDILRFELDGVMNQQLSGSSSWGQVNVPVPAGSHKLTWKYKKDAAGSAGADAGFVDQIMYVQNLPRLVVGVTDINVATPFGVNPPAQSFEVWNEGGGLLTYTITENSPWLSASPGTGSSSGESNPVTLTFNATTLKAGTWTTRVAVTPAGGTSQFVDVRLVVAGSGTVPLATALDFTPTGGWGTNTVPSTQGWTGQTTDSFDKTDCARSGSVVPDGGASSLIATIQGPATISFYWRTDCEAGYDQLLFLNAGTEVASISGRNLPWQPVTYSVGAGSHTLIWKYRKDSSQAEGLDCGFLDKVVVSTSTPQLNVSPGSITASTAGGSNPEAQSLLISNSGGGTMNYSLSSNQGWCYLPVNKGTAAKETDTLSVVFDTAALAAGNYEARIRVDAGVGGALHIPVFLTVHPGNFTVATIPGSGTYTQAFGSSVLPTAAAGWSFFSNGEGRISVQSGALRMDDRVSGSLFSLNEATLHANLQGLSGVTLSFKHREADDENHLLPDQFTGRANGDGVSISADGATWYVIDHLSTADGSWTTSSISLDDAIAAAGIAFTSDFQIKFQQYDDSPWSNDGFEFDDIALSLGTALDDHGNSIIAATPVNPSGSQIGKIEVPGDQDFFRLSLPATTDMAISTTGGLDTLGDLYDAAGNLLATNNDGAGIGKNFLLRRSLGAGSYYIRVRGAKGAKGNYVLVTSSTSAVTLVSLARPSEDWVPLTYTPFVPSGYLTEMSGLLKLGYGPSLQVLGHLKLKGTHAGSFSGTIIWNGTSYLLGGTFTNGTFNGTASLKDKPRLSVSLGFFINGSINTGEWRLLGQVSDGITTAEAVLLENWDWSAINHVGNYTIIIPGEDNASPTEPQGSAYGTLSIAKHGDGTLKLSLPDGTLAAVSLYLTNQPNGQPEASFYTSTPSGFIAGEFRMRDEPGVSDLDGYVWWRKFPAAKGTYYPGGFALNRSILGSRFAAQANLPDLPGVVSSAQGTFFGGNLAYVPGVRAITWTAADKLSATYAGETWSFGVASSVVSGSYKHSASGSSFKFGGGIFQKQSKVMGYFLGLQQSGSMSLTP
jgi:hypothetical protein